MSMNINEFMYGSDVPRVVNVDIKKGKKNTRERERKHMSAKQQMSMEEILSTKHGSQREIHTCHQSNEIYLCLMKKIQGEKERRRRKTKRGRENSNKQSTALAYIDISSFNNFF